MKVMIYYIVIGVIIMFVLEAINNAYENQLNSIGEEVPKFSTFDRILGIVIWPVVLGFIVKEIKKLF